MAPHGNNVAMRAALDADTGYAPLGRGVAMDVAQHAEMEEEQELAAAHAHHMAKQSPDDPEAYIKGVVADLHVTVIRGANMFFKDTVVPQATSIEEELEQLQHDVASVTGEAQHEKELVEQELARLSELVLHFQQRIARFLSGAGQVQG